MGLFSSKNNTVSDKKMADLRRKAEKAQKDKDMFSKRAVEKRKANSKQKSKSIWS